MYNIKRKSSLPLVLEFVRWNNLVNLSECLRVQVSSSDLYTLSLFCSVSFPGSFRVQFRVAASWRVSSGLT